MKRKDMRLLQAVFGGGLVFSAITMNPAITFPESILPQATVIRIVMVGIGTFLVYRSGFLR